MRQLKTLGLFVWRVGLVLAGVLTLVLLFVVVLLERVLRLLTPAICSPPRETFRCKLACLQIIRFSWQP